MITWRQLFIWFNQSCFCSCIWFMTLSSSERVAVDDRWILLNSFSASWSVPLDGNEVCFESLYILSYGWTWNSQTARVLNRTDSLKKISDSGKDLGYTKSDASSAYHAFPVQSEPLVFDSFSRIFIWKVCACLFIYTM